MLRRRRMRNGRPRRPGNSRRLDPVGRRRGARGPLQAGHPANVVGMPVGGNQLPYIRGA